MQEKGAVLPLQNFTSDSLCEHVLARKLTLGSLNISAKCAAFNEAIEGKALEGMPHLSWVLLNVAFAG